MNNFDMIRAIEANVANAEHCDNFWVMRDVLQKNPEVLGDPYIVWEVEDTPQPDDEQIEQWIAELPALIPESVTSRQGKLALLDAGKLEAVEQAIASIADETEKKAAAINYDAPTWERGNDFLNQLWEQLGGTQQELDDLFILASKK